MNIAEKIKGIRHRPVIIGVLLLALMLITVFSLAFGKVGRYAYAERYCETNIAAAIDALENVPNSYKDTAKLRAYLQAQQELKNKNYDKAQPVFEKLDYYRNSRVYLSELYFKKACLLREQGEFLLSAEYFEKSNVEGARVNAMSSKYAYADSLLQKGESSEAAEEFLKLKDYSDSFERYLECRIALAEEYSLKGEHEKAVEIIAEAEGKSVKSPYREKLYSIYFVYGESLLENGNYQAAAEIFKKATAYTNETAAAEKQKYCENMLIYNVAVELMKGEKYAEAVSEFDKIVGFLDADKLNTDCEKKVYGWDFTGFLSKDGTEKTKTKTFVRADTIYFYGTLTGGKPNKSVNLLFVWVDCANRSVTCRVEDWTDGSSGGVTFSYTNPKNANFGKSTITVYVEETGEQLAKYNFNIKK